MTLWSPCAVLGTRSVNVAGPRFARSRTVSIRAGVAAVLLATTSTRVGEEDSIAAPFVGAPRLFHAFASLSLHLRVVSSQVSENAPPMHRAARSDRGQATVDYVALLGLVALVL